ncbi:hypothetical protein M5689_014199 [Euphorbia peplus]|nr:hypothetical protein M5689_014199 [Euphorbia peplus]
MATIKRPTSFHNNDFCAGYNEEAHRFFSLHHWQKQGKTLKVSHLRGFLDRHEQALQISEWMFDQGRFTPLATDVAV